ncbi:LamG-like jellyroll fold domain-containing protein [Streptomyces sp. NPDC127178]|uniref:LamG-like jellyroll fold domain-containing protein n=1 Tax=unclassified Streptomyces TaxID=2593676 RepID=UPI0036428939
MDLSKQRHKDARRFGLPSGTGPAMQQLVLHHTYLDGSTFDVSGNGNHGIPHAVVPGTGDEAGSHWFGVRDSGIMVAASPSLAQLDAIRVRVKFRVEDLSERRNLVEGHLSFALYAEGARGLTGTLLDANGVWAGVHADGLITEDQWCEAELAHDGVSTLTLGVNGQRVAVRADVQGPVRSVGGLGVAIGRWPDRPTYTFQGDIGELQIWRYDPVRTVQNVLDPCCKRSKKPLEKVIAGIGDGNADRDSLAEHAREAERATLEFLHSMDGEGRAELQQLGAETWALLKKRDWDALRFARKRLQAAVTKRSTPEARAAWQEHLEGIARGARFGSDEQRAVAQAFCLDALMPPVADDPRHEKPDPGGPWDIVDRPGSEDPMPPPAGDTSGRPDRQEEHT